MPVAVAVAVADKVGLGLKEGYEDGVTLKEGRADWLAEGDADGVKEESADELVEGDADADDNKEGFTEGVKDA